MEFKCIAIAVPGPTRLIAIALAMLLWSVYLPGVQGADTAPTGDKKAASAPGDAIVFFDTSTRLELDLGDGGQRHAHWDEMHLIAALQGLVNRDQPRLFIRYMREPDDFWWGQMTRPGAWLAGREIVHVTTLDELLARFRDSYSGFVAWDENVPATSNVATTVAGCDNLLPLRYDMKEGSLYRRLTEAPGALPVKVRLCQDDGSRLFTGSGKVPGTKLLSTGSAKCDAYEWLLENYVRTGKANPSYMGYYLDAFWLSSAKASKPENNTLCNQDFIVAKRGVCFDLGVWGDEAPVDDPGQRPGTDLATMKKLLRANYDRLHGNGIIHVSGFIPWAFKYVEMNTNGWAAGGHHKGVPTEWQYAEILSCFNAFIDADALGFSAMSNASFYAHYPLAAHYPQNARPTRASLQAQGVLDAKGRIVPRSYISFYMGSYDSAAWLYHWLPKMWADPARGSLPLTWSFDPNLAERFPFGMAWAREKRTKNDTFAAGDSGAGYLNPGFLTPPRVQSGLPSGMSAWEQYCSRLYKQWDLSLTGFVLEGFATGLAPEGMDAYARFSPDGIVAHKSPERGVHNGMPFLRMNADLKGTPQESAGIILQHISGVPERFFVFRDVLKSPTWHLQVEQELHRTLGDQVKVLDLYSLLWLVRNANGPTRGQSAAGVGQPPTDAEIAEGNIPAPPEMPEQGDGQ